MKAGKVIEDLIVFIKDWVLLNLNLTKINVPKYPSAFITMR